MPQTEAEAYELLEKLRWGDDGPTECPHCASSKGAWFLKPKNPAGRKSKGGSESRSSRRVWKCRETTCRRQFSVLNNTVMHRTKMPVQTWVGVVLELCSAPTGVSAREIAARWNISEKSAWTMLDRLKDAFAHPETAGASLATTAPLWFEIPAQPIDRAAKKAADRKTKLDDEAAATAAAEQVKQDVQRALREAATAPIANRGADPVELAKSAAPKVRVDREKIAQSDQVKADVQRALVEAFQLPLSPPVADDSSQSTQVPERPIDEASKRQRPAPQTAASEAAQESPNRPVRGPAPVDETAARPDAELGAGRFNSDWVDPDALTASSMNQPNDLVAPDDAVSNALESSELPPDAYESALAGPAPMIVLDQDAEATGRPARTEAAVGAVVEGDAAP